MDFEQLAFIEKWRRKATRGAIVALDATRGDTLLTLRAGDLGATLDLSGRDATGAIRKHRLTIGDRVFAAFRYRVADVTPAGDPSGTRAIAKGAEVRGTLTELGELYEIDIDGITILVEGEEALGAFAPGAAIRFRIADEGRAYVIPTR